MMNRTVLNCVAAAAMAGAAFSASAQDTTAAVVATQAGSLPKGFAAPSFEVPTGSGSGWGNIGVGVFGQTVDYTNQDVDGSMGINIGLGDPAKYFGVDVSLGLSSLAGNGGGSGSFGEDGSFGVKLHTNLPDLMSFAVGVSSIGRFGALKNPGVGKSSVYTALTKFFPMGTQGLSLTVGAGDVAYSSHSGIGPIGSVAYYFTPQISLIGEYTGRYANAALSIAPFKRLPLTVTLGGLNLADRTNGPGQQFGASIGYGISF